MKTVKIKVKPLGDTQATAERYREELTWIWNKCRWLALHNHCVDWYKAADKWIKEAESYPQRFEAYKRKLGRWKQSGRPEDKPEKPIEPLYLLDSGVVPDLEGIVCTPLFFFKKAAWNNASCKIAFPIKKNGATVVWSRICKPGLEGGSGDGSRWETDESIVIRYWDADRKEHRTKHGLRLVPGKDPWIPDTPVAHDYPELTFLNNRGKKNQAVKTVQLKAPKDLDNKGLLNTMRASEGLDDLTVDTDFIGGLLKTVFPPAWDAYKDPNLINRKQPKYKDTESPVSTFANSQGAPVIEGDIFTCGSLKFQACDRSWQSRMGGLIPFGYKVIQKPSGWYICITVQTTGERSKPTFVSRRNKLAGSIKRAVGKDKQAQQQALADSPDYQRLTTELTNLESQIKQENLDQSSCARRTGLIAGVDPGVKAIVATDGGHLFSPNYARQRVDIHIAQLQNKLDVMRDRNDKKQGAKWKAGGRASTKNEDRLRSQISRLHERAANSGSMFNQKLSTRLARNYDAIGWENTQLKNMSKTADPKLAEDGSKWEQNNASAKSGLNHSLRVACMGDLRAKTKQKMEAAGKHLIDSTAQNSSQKCHCCEQKGERVTQAIFQCLNPDCKLYQLVQNADTNSAKNHKKPALKLLISN